MPRQQLFSYFVGCCTAFLNQQIQFCMVKVLAAIKRFLFVALCSFLFFSCFNILNRTQRTSAPRNTAYEPYTNDYNSIQFSRKMENGTAIFSAGYVDQPYIVKLSGKIWLCCYTWSNTNEGGRHETVGISRSNDSGKTWQFQSSLEEGSGASAFYGIPFANSFGRVYVFYGYNIDNVTTLNNKSIRTDAVGELCYKYSEDSGNTWSKRQTIAMPVTQYDSLNDWHGKYQEWWSICKPILANNELYFSFTKVEKYVYINGEGWVVNCPNINKEHNVAKLTWNFLPPGNTGIRSSAMGITQEEHNIVQLNNGGFACVFRTQNGYPAICYSNDNCNTWTEPRPMMFSTGNLMRHPRACPRIFKCSNGNYLLWFNNRSMPSKIWWGRNPIWVCGGVEKNGTIIWSQPEILLNSDDDAITMSYPDLVEAGNEYYVTETQKNIARIHKINANFLKNLWLQGKETLADTAYKIAEFSESFIESAFDTKVTFGRSGFSGGLTINLALNVSSNQKTSEKILSILFTGSSQKTAIRIETVPGGTIKMIFFSNTGEELLSFESDSDVLKPNSPNFVSFDLDASNRILTIMVNGVLCNGLGTDAKPAGWARIPKGFDFSLLSNYMIFHQFTGKTTKATLFNVPLTTTSLISQYQFR